MLVDVARRLAEPAEKLLTDSFRFAGWVVGRAAGPVFSLVGATSRPVVRTLSALSPIATQKIQELLPYRGASRPDERVKVPPLPVANWDGLTIAAIRQRTRTLGAAELVALLAYERAHAARPAVVLNLENRLATLRHGNGTHPTRA